MLGIVAYIIEACALFTGASRPLILLMAAAAFVQSPALALALFASAFAARDALTLSRDKQDETPATIKMRQVQPAAA